MLFFKVQKVCPPAETEEEEGGGAHLADRQHTSLYMVTIMIFSHGSCFISSHVVTVYLTANVRNLRINDVFVLQKHAKILCYLEVMWLKMFNFSNGAVRHF